MSKTDATAVTLGRRTFLTVASGAAAAAGLAMTAGNAAAKPEDAKALIDKITGGAALQEGKVSIDAPQIAENGNTVPIAVSVDSPMTEADHVKKLHVMADDNPSPEVATFNFTPSAGKAEVSIRIRMARTQNVIAVAEMSDGSFQTARQEVKVTIGGCGG